MFSGQSRVLPELDTDVTPQPRPRASKQIQPPRYWNQPASKPPSRDLPAPPTINNQKSLEEQIEHRLTNILESVQADIKFAKRSGNPKIPSKLPLRTNTSTATTTTQPRQPSLTITPAFPSDKEGPGTSANKNVTSDVKLYHLSQTSSSDAQSPAPPMKLFLRLVGDSRIMVRVGGGWADFGDVSSYNPHHPPPSCPICVEANI